MFNFISRYFALNRRERNGTIVMAGMLVTLLLVKLGIRYVYHPDVPEVVIIRLDHLLSQVKANKPLTVLDAKVDKPAVLKIFDPNQISYQEALDLGFEQKTAHILLHFRKKGGVFRAPKDLIKLYGMKPAFYERLKPYIKIDLETEKEKLYRAEKKPNLFKAIKPQKIYLEINSADSLAWLKLPGIGPGYTHMILKYRKQMGGFYATDQLKEIYRFSDTLYKQIEAYLTVDTSVIQKIPVNSVEFKVMLRHPYIKYEGTKCIFALKKNKRIEAADLIRSSCFSREQLTKVLKYLNFE